jgi:hypothetical protein
VVIPGNVTIAVQGNVLHKFGNDVRMVVTMEKQLLGVWTKVPCAQSVGSWYLLLLYNIYYVVKFKMQFSFVEKGNMWCGKQQLLGNKW